jgi:ArsR family metal-binding transcriptional regulator
MMMSERRPGYYAKGIDVVLEHIEEELGFSVDLFDRSLPRCEEEAVLGRISYEKRIISIHCYCSGCKLMTLLHEAGHAIDFLGGLQDITDTHDEREERAETYGRLLSDGLGLELVDEWAYEEVRYER